MPVIETHPLKPFLPQGARLLMLGSFPPQRTRWSMEFYYPNFQNDMWRIMGIVFFGDRDKFVIPGEKRFNRNVIEEFCRNRGIALSDTAAEVIRTRNNAADKYLDIVTPFDIAGHLCAIPECIAVAATGEKAADTFAAAARCSVPATGQCTQFIFNERKMLFYRMPSTSRAYPKPLDEKAATYKNMFQTIGLL